MFAAEMVYFCTFSTGLRLRLGFRIVVGGERYGEWEGSPVTLPTVMPLLCLK